MVVARESEPPENEHNSSFSEGCDVDCQEEVVPPKMSTTARFQGYWIVQPFHHEVRMVGSFPVPPPNHHRKQASTLVFNSSLSFSTWV